MCNLEDITDDRAYCIAKLLQEQKDLSERSFFDKNAKEKLVVYDPYLSKELVEQLEQYADATLNLEMCEEQEAIYNKEFPLPDWVERSYLRCLQIKVPDEYYQEWSELKPDELTKVPAPPRFENLSAGNWPVFKNMFLCWRELIPKEKDPAVCSYRGYWKYELRLLFTGFGQQVLYLDLSWRTMNRTIFAIQDWARRYLVVQREYERLLSLPDNQVNIQELTKIVGRKVPNRPNAILKALRELEEDKTQAA